MSRRERRAYERSEASRHAQKREALFRAEAARDPNGLFIRIRTGFDAQIVACKREIAARGMARDFVCAPVVNPRIDAGESRIACSIEVIHRDKVREQDAAPELAEIRDRLASPPPEGHVWVWIPIPNHRLLVAEPVEHSVDDAPTTAPGGDA